MPHALADRQLAAAKIPPGRSRARPWRLMSAAHIRILGAGVGSRSGAAPTLLHAGTGPDSQDGLTTGMPYHAAAPARRWS